MSPNTQTETTPEEISALASKQDSTAKPYMPGGQLAERHWSYVEQILVLDGLSEEQIERIAFHYCSAFIHGWKHCNEDFNKAPERREKDGS